jgi:hypothetical protein
VAYSSPPTQNPDRSITVRSRNSASAHAYSASNILPWRLPSYMSRSTLSQTMTLS